MKENASVEQPKEPRAQKTKCFWCAAIAGAVAALSGVFAYCVYHAHTRMHEGLCDCAKYGAMIVAAFSHPIAIAGALAGVCLLAIVYLVRNICRHYSQRRADSSKRI